MKHIFEQKVFYSDTDAYGVVWHGSYLRWLEMGRVGVCEMLGHNLIDLKDKDIVLPVVNLNVKYKMSAKLNDVVVTETEISEFNGFTVKFKQIIRSKETGKVCIDAEVSVVAIDNNGKLYRKMPEVLAKSFDEVLKCKELV
ncbi:tol-pal system-associated acyl-CoA thioesterase [Clostridium sp. CAG:813]|nr:tol-pal system-associated acyl-CoA thioesterase [Clostridium sp. CAG:813]